MAEATAPPAATAGRPAAEPSATFPHVFEPLTLRHPPRSRINFGAHTANMAEGGLVSATATSATTASVRSAVPG